MLDEAQAVIHGWRQWQVEASKPEKPLPPFTPSKAFTQTSPGRHLSDISLISLWHLSDISLKKKYGACAALLHHVLRQASRLRSCQCSGCCLLGGFIKNLSFLGKFPISNEISIFNLPFRISLTWMDQATRATHMSRWGNKNISINAMVEKTNQILNTCNKGWFTMKTRIHAIAGCFVIHPLPAGDSEREQAEDEGCREFQEPGLWRVLQHFYLSGESCHRSRASQVPQLTQLYTRGSGNLTNPGQASASNSFV